ncbi:pentatricopeptide repeat-containing protein At5g02860-like [Cryptomeria japonica]|uniref:pentatricopeptide repeat-containing protein At5g02860-like n=1 Tax=Cryptomeria japonica TaxID=3369 RepID=UPI0027DAAD95|nr:pentatricopeptide repeat-containing protein At5g02860-like [Cryptomeria japonica]
MCARNRGHKFVDRVYKEMMKAGVYPSHDTFNMLISAYGSCGLINRALATYSAMLEEGISPNLLTYNTISNAISRKAHWKEAEAVLKDMNEKGYKPNADAYASLLHAYANGYNLEQLNTLERDIQERIIHPSWVLLKSVVQQKICKVYSFPRRNCGPLIQLFFGTKKRTLLEKNLMNTIDWLLH